MTRSFLDRFYSFIAYIQGCIQEFVQGGGLCTRWDFTGPGASLAPIAPAPKYIPAFIFYQGQNFALYKKN